MTEAEQNRVIAMLPSMERLLHELRAGGDPDALGSVRRALALGPETWALPPLLWETHADVHVLYAARRLREQQAVFDLGDHLPLVRLLEEAVNIVAMVR